MRHILITGRCGVGKSTLIRALIRAIPAPVCGMITKKEAAGPDGFCPVFIHTYGEPKRFDDYNRVGLCREGKSIAFPEAFDRFAETMRYPRECVIVLDELGFMESEAHTFTETVMHTLDEAPLVIAAVRDKDTPFLDAVRAHLRADVYRIDEQNRGEVRETLLNDLPLLLPDLFR
ncbi:MAG: AAA family ATPase [Clostridia bacterium]|nr:AAA family ATPase [Clostridia bacterium]